MAKFFTSLPAHPTGLAPKAIATVRFVQDEVNAAVSAGTFWKRLGITIETKTANDDVKIDSFLRINGSSDTQQLIIKGHSTQTANLQEWQNGSAVLQANMTNSGAFRNYVSYTDASNYEAGIFDWQENSGDLTIGALRTGEYAGRNVIVQATDSTGDGVYYGRVGGALTLKAGKPWDQASVYPNSYGGQIKIDTFTYNGVAPNYGDITIESAYNDRNAGRKSRVNIKSYNTTLIERGALGARPTTATTTIKQFSGQISNLLNFVNSSWTDSSAQNNILSSFDYLGNYLNYNTYTDASNYERAVFTWDTNILKIKTEALGTGTVRPIEIQGAGATILGDASTDVPLTVKGATSQSDNLQELQNSAGSTLTAFNSTGKLIFTSAGLIDFGNWTLSESGVALYYNLSGANRAVIQNGLHATYGWELSWLNTSSGNRFGFISSSEGDVELRGTKNITTSPMSFSVYNTYTNSSNYERAVFDWKTSSNVLTIGTQALGTGTVRPIEIISTTKIKALRETVTTVSTSTTLTHTMTYVRQTASSITTTLWASPVTGDTVTIRNRGGGSNTIDGNGTNIEGASTLTIYDGEGIDLVYDGSEWTV